jgi:hypothetical protein
MTREFNNQRRDDNRSSFRNSGPPTRHNNEQRPSHTSRPRLSRETVDRAWENGATRTHADYHPRSAGQSGQPPRNNWQNRQHPAQGAEGAQSHDAHNARRQGPPSIYGRNSFQRFGQNQGEHQQRSHFGAQQRDGRPDMNTQTRRPYGPRHTDEQQGRPYGQQRPQRGGFGAPHAGGRNEQERPSYAPHAHNERYQQSERGYQGQNRRFERHEDNPRRQHDAPYGRDTYNQQRDHRSYGPNARPERAQHEQPNYRPAQRFEGDYEQFNQDDRRERGNRFQGRNGRNDYNERYQPRNNNETAQQYGERTRNQHAHSHQESEEDRRHTTTLSDGRVIKGSRPQQRRQARFWTEINDESHQLAQHDTHAPSRPAAEERPTNTDRAGQTAERFQPADRPVPAEGKARRRPSSALKERKLKNKKTHATTGPRPSQRGFKWPTQSTQ